MFCKCPKEIFFNQSVHLKKKITHLQILFLSPLNFFFLFLVLFCFVSFVLHVQKILIFFHDFYFKGEIFYIFLLFLFRSTIYFFNFFTQNAKSYLPLQVSKNFLILLSLKSDKFRIRNGRFDFA